MILPTLGRYPRLPLSPRKERNSETETVGEGSRVSSRGMWPKSLNMNHMYDCMIKGILAAPRKATPPPPGIRG